MIFKGNVGAAEGHPDLDWSFVSVPQTGLNGKQMPVPRYSFASYSPQGNVMTFSGQGEDARRLQRSELFGLE